MENKTAGGFNSSAASAADNVMNKAALGAHSAVDKAASLADEASRKAKPAIEKVAGYAHQAVDRAAGVAAPAADWLDEHSQDLKASQEKLINASVDYIKANPWKTVGIAVGRGSVARSHRSVVIRAGSRNGHSRRLWPRLRNAAGLARRRGCCCSRGGRAAGDGGSKHLR
jgi:ElaB/YqjD/DUF883 family membrane-anchored ribosome-binding protein